MQFTSKFWLEFLKLLGTSQGLSTLYHPQISGACEYMNGILLLYKLQQNDWADLFPFAEVTNNNLVHSSMGFAPFYVATNLKFAPKPEFPQHNSLAGQ